MMNLRRIICLAGFGLIHSAVSHVAWAERLSVESALIDSASGNNIGVSKNAGQLEDFFDIQKKLVFDTLKDLGIDFASLPDGVRQSLVKHHTKNLEAFRAFSSGLNALDEGKYAEARTFFEQAVALDPEFALAAEMQTAMPASNVYSGIQLQAALREAAKNAVSAGKTQVEVDASRAVAALLSGQEVVVAVRDEPLASDSNSGGFNANPPGSGDQYAKPAVVGLAYQINGNRIALVGEWSVDAVRSSAAGLESVGNSNEFALTRGSANVCCTGGHTLVDGTEVSWGRWNSSPGATATLVTQGVSATAPTLGTVDYVWGAGTTVMPGTGTASFSPVGGSLQNVSGTIDVDFVARRVNLNSLGFAVSGVSFSGLNGVAFYTANSSQYSGNFSSGSCTGCAAFSAGAGSYSGGFVGANAAGTVLSTMLQTGNSGAATVGGTHLFAQ